MIGSPAKNLDSSLFSRPVRLPEEGWTGGHSGEGEEETAFGLL